jgi:hypothetical protein
MAQYEHLPIYKQALSLSLYIEKVVQGFSRYHKYSNGTELRTLARNNIKLIIRANSENEQRIFYLNELRANNEELKVCIRICKEMNAFKNLNSFVHAVELVILLAKQNEAWLKSQHKIINAPAS